MKTVWFHRPVFHPRTSPPRVLLLWSLPGVVSTSDFFGEEIWHFLLGQHSSQAQNQSPLKKKKPGLSSPNEARVHHSCTFEISFFGQSPNICALILAGPEGPVVSTHFFNTFANCILFWTESDVSSLWYSLFFVLRHWWGGKSNPESPFHLVMSNVNNAMISQFHF